MTNRREEIKKENRKSLKVFIVILIAAGIVGGIIGGVGIRFSDNMKDITSLLAQLIKQGIVYIMPAAAIIFCILTWILYRQSKSLLSTWDGENEEIPTQIDIKTGYGIWISAINQIFSFFCFAVGLSDSMMYGEIELKNVFIIVVVFAVNNFLIIFTQQKFFDLTKEMNPEKSGSVYDFKFQNKWMDSCDEAEKMQTFQAGWSAFRVMNIVYVISWMVTYLANDFLGVDIFACIMVVILWGIQTSVYCAKTIQLSR